MLDNICVIISEPGDLITQRLVYGLNCDQAAAAELLEFLLDKVASHPKISESVRHQVHSITGRIIFTPTRNADEESKEAFAAQKKRHEQFFGHIPFLSEKYNVISRLTSEKLMEHFRNELAKDDEQGYYNAEFWAELAKTFNPSVRIPEEFTRKQARYRASREADQWRKNMEGIAFPAAPMLPTFYYQIPSDPSPSYSYLDEEERKRLDDLVSDYWAEQAAKQAAAEIEGLWSDLDSIGFWSDTSWQ
jgi:heat shock protein HspQ